MPNAIRLGSHITRTQANGGITPGAIAIWPCHHATTNNALTDISGNGNNTVAGASFVGATHFAGTDGVITPDSSGSSDFAQRLEAAQFSYGVSGFANGDTLLIAGRMKLTAGYPALSRPIIAQGGNNSAAQGIRLSMKATTGALLMAWDGASSVFSADTDTAAPSSGWFSYMFALWGHTPAAGTAYYGIWLNGASAFTTYPKSATNLPTSMVPTEALRIGAYHRTTGPVDASIGATHASIHIYRAPASVAQTTNKMDALARRLYRDPETPLSLAEWPMA